jgi:hypothetical protein
LRYGGDNSNRIHGDGCDDFEIGFRNKKSALIHKLSPAAVIFSRIIAQA